jgi:hypothetical protein
VDRAFILPILILAITYPSFACSSSITITS